MNRPTHASLKKEALQNPIVKAEYEALEEEFALVAELIRARKMNGKSQKEVAKAMHTSPSAISRLESGFGRERHTPSIDTLRRYAGVLGRRLSIKLVPK
jgi:DNA-binding XRE family transcriptional regulator